VVWSAEKTNPLALDADIQSFRLFAGPSRIDIQGICLLVGVTATGWRRSRRSPVRAETGTIRKRQIRWLS
jgi:hypothetical protein